MKKKIMICLLSLAPMTIYAATKLAEVNGKEITLEDFEKKYRLNLSMYQTTPMSKRDVLDDIITREIAVQTAKKMGLEKDPLVQERMETVLFTALIEKELGSKFKNVKIDDSEVKTRYSKYPMIRTSHILVMVSPTASADEAKKAKAKIDALYLQVKKTPDKFADIARKESQSPEGPLGGDLNFKTQDELDPSFYDAALKLKKDEISAPVRSQFGWHIIKRTDTMPFEKADKGKVRAAIFDEKRQKIFKDYFDNLRKQNNVKADYSLLK